MADTANSSLTVKRDSTSGQLIELERYRLLVESVQDYAIFLLDTQGYVASWNAGARRFKGYSEAEIIGKHFSIFYMQEDLDTDKPGRKLIEATKNGRVEDEGWRIRKDGTRFWANVVITALYNEKGILQGFAKVTRDLTDRKAMEDELAAANEELKRQKHMLTLLNEAKDEFISLASHQLRTPATGVKQYLNLILQGYLGEIPDKLVPALQQANDSNERQIGLINDLLRVAQLDAGKIALNLQLTDLSRLIADVVAEQHDTFAERKQRTALHLPRRPLMVSIDSQRLRMVLENLVDNASKYTQPGGTIDISLSAAGGWVSVAIKDTGVGIKAKDIARLFHKFSRIKNDLSDKVGGSGLGLYWAERVVALHGGTIAVTSTAGKGSVFTVRIPQEN